MGAFSISKQLLEKNLCNFISELCDLNRNLMYSNGYEYSKADEAVKEMEDKIIRCKYQYYKLAKTSNANNIILMIWKLKRRCKEYLDDLT